MTRETLSSIFYLIDDTNAHLAPCVMDSRKRGERGYQTMPPGKGNDVSSALITLDPEIIVRKVVTEGWLVRVEPKGDRSGSPASMSIGGKANARYWLRPDLHHWVAGATMQPVNAGSGR